MVEELLRGMVDVDYFETTNELLEHLIINLAESKTAQVWIQNLIKPLFILMRFIRSEREGEYLLQLNAAREMLPSFFAA